MKHRIPYTEKTITRLMVWALAAAFLAAAGPSPASSETLDEAFKAAMAKDYRLKASEEQVAAAEESLSAAKSLRLPSLTGEAAYTVLDNIPGHTVSISPLLPSLTLSLLEDDRLLVSSVTVSLPVFTSFRISHAVKGAEAAVDAEKAGRLNTAQDIRLKTAEAYVSVLRAERGLAVAQSNVTALSAHARDVEHFYAQGLVPKNDVLAVQVALADARQTEIRVANALSLARSAYNRQLGRSLDAEVHLDDLSFETSENGPDGDALTRRALENRSEIRELSDQARALSCKARSIRAAALPQVQVSGSFHHLTNTPLDEENIWSGSLGVRWDLFDGGVIRHQARAEERKKAVLENMRLEAESLIRLQVRQAVLDVSETSKRISVTREALAQAEENLRIAKNRYAREIGNNTEVLDAETLRIKSMTNHDNAVYDRVMAELRLKRASGDL